MEAYKLDGTKSVLIEKHMSLADKRKAKTFLTTPSQSSTSEGQQEQDLIQIIETKLEQMRKSLIKIPTEFVNGLKEMLNLLQIPVLTAHADGEFLGTCLLKKGRIDYFVTNDSDLIALNAPHMITNINTSNSTFDFVNIDKIKNSLDMTCAQLLDFCILLGNDFNENIRGFGPVKCFNLLTKHKDYDSLKKNNPKMFALTNGEFPYKESKSVFEEQKENEEIVVSFTFSKKYQEFEESQLSELFFQKLIDQSYLKGLLFAFKKLKTE